MVMIVKLVLAETIKITCSQRMLNRVTYNASIALVRNSDALDRTLGVNARHNTAGFIILGFVVLLCAWNYRLRER